MSAADFDFLHGSWRISHRYLRERLAGCDQWETFESAMRCWPILGGAGNMDEGEMPSRGLHGMTIRLYDKDADTWSLFWIDSRFARIEPPVTGRFTPDSVRWAQALSADGGTTWETNWIMDLTRT